MASANFLEEALKSDVDESAVNAIVGTLENQLDVNTNLVQQVGSVGKPDAGDSAIAEVPNGATATPQQKPDLGGGLANGEIAVSNNNTITANNNAPAKPTIVTSANSPSTATVVARPSVALPKSGVPQQQQQRSNSVVIAGGGATRGGGNINIISQQIVVPPPPFNVPSSSQKQTLTTAGNSIVLSNHQLHQPSSNMPKNEPVKLVYPAGAQQTAAVLNMNNNRVTLTPSGLSNGTITMSQQPQLIQTANLVGKTTTTSSALQQQQQAGGGGVSGQPTPTLIIKNQQTNTVMNSGAPGIVTVSKPMNNQITLSALQGQQGSTLLLKNEQGQFQLLRIGPAPTGTQITPASLTPSSTNQTIRLQTVPAVSRFTGPPLALRNTTVTSTQQVKQKQNTHASGTGTIIVSSQSGTTPQTSYISTQPTPVASVAPVPALAAQQNITITHTSASPATVLSTQQSQQQQQHGSTGSVAGQQTSQQQQQQPTVVVTTTPAVTQQRNSLDNTKEKCSKFLTNLIELSKREPTKVEQNVRTLIQELVDANVDPAEFCERLERLLNASPQPCLIGFLKKSLPLLRQSLVTKEITIEGINPPSAAVAFAGTALSSIPAQIRPVAPTIVSQGSMIGQTQIRMLTNQSGVTTLPRIGQTTIRPAAPIRIQTPLQQQSTVTAGGTTIVGQPRTSTLTTQQIRPNVTTIGHTTIVQTAGQQLPQTISTTPPALLPVSGNAKFNASAQQQNLSGAAAASAKKKASASAASSAGADQDASKRAGASAQSQFYHHHAAMYGEDDINDVAAMGGVNLAEETQRILGSTEFVGTQIRSCKDEVFLHLPALQSRIRNIIARHGLEEPSNEVAVLISHACQERLKNVVEKLAIIAEHRIDIIKVDPRYEVTKDVRGQIKFLEELDKAEQKRHEEQEREMLMRAAKSRSKTEDPEQAKLKAKAKEMQRAEMEELRQRDANLTALQAIGPRKKPKLEEGSSTSATPGASGIGSLSGKAPTPLRPRIKRVNLRDMLFYMEQERESCRSQMLYKAYLK
ncbi:transcription initiation factor TFIID subunit 4-like isoform X3 [Anopheles aquasalis]|uniref:transcription initiation factor TFIID subunit 4-like isoform X3 n=1 Tax=Anopheles aquasalis TaxID=42839 RepID=UPI00215B1BDF|nr:transcription initiation factor TFIID subunit 4-like isoform X3 [Anopheles aquasalis]